jgi:hypothetical protein
MQMLEIIGLFIGLTLAVSLSLVVLLRSAEALSWRRERQAHPEAVVDHTAGRLTSLAG